MAQWYKESTCQCRTDSGVAGLIPGLERSPEVGNGYPSILAWKSPWTEEPDGPQSGVAKSQMQLSGFPL